MGSSFYCETYPLDVRVGLGSEVGSQTEKWRNIYRSVSN
jgi:hypothetical protein